MYKYEDLKDKVSSLEGLTLFFQVKEIVDNFLKLTSAFQMRSVLAKISGDSWLIMACVDRLKELGHIKELTDGNVFGQYRTFIAN